MSRSCCGAVCVHGLSLESWCDLCMQDTTDGERIVPLTPVCTLPNLPAHPSTETDSVRED